MSWSRVKAIYLDVGKAGGENPLLDGKRGYAGSVPGFIQGDCLTLQLWLRSVTSGSETTTVVELPAGSVIVIAAKVKATLATSELLFFTDSFTQQGSGDDIYYESELDLNVEAIDTALGESASSVEIRIDVEVQDAGNAARATMQMDGLIYRQVYASETPPPVLGTPSGGLHRVKDGQWQFKNVDTGLWKTLWLAGANDAITVGPGEE